MRIPELPPNGKNNKFAFIGMRKEKGETAIKDKQYAAPSTVLWQNRSTPNREGTATVTFRTHF